MSKTPNSTRRNSSPFDEIVGRENTSSVKWDKYAGTGILPMWVADMDFPAPPAVVAALHERVDHGIFGYTHAPLELEESVVAMLASEYDWPVPRESIVWLPGLVTGINVACRAVEGDIFTATPIYPPFLSSPIHSGKRVKTARMVLESGRWVNDTAAIEAAAEDCGLFLLCNPHNPTGRIFERSELEKIAELCLSKNLYVCSDEIHCGILLDEKRHIPFASLSPEIAKRTITLMAPSKTYNIPGLACSFAVVEDEALRRKFLNVMAGIVPHVNALGYAAALAAYRDSGEWHEELLGYLRGNRDLVESEIAKMGLSVSHIEATYLAWIDASHIENPAAFFEATGVGLSDGRDFGAEGFVRLNFGCPRSRLIEALSRMKHALPAKNQAGSE